LARIVYRLFPCALGLTSLAGCGETPAPEPGLECVRGLTAECSPLYPTSDFTTLYTKILHPSCATGGSTCHTKSGSKGGLVFEDEQQSYALLLGQVDGRQRVVPGDASCSILIERLEVNSSTLRMPPGPTPLSEGERCNFVQWVANGAAR
jgi:cytochrome c